MGRWRLLGKSQFKPNVSFFLLVALIAAGTFGCGARSPVAPEPASLDNASFSGDTPLAQAVGDGPYRLWGEWTFFLDAEHERVDVIPRRQGRFHLNALKFLEEYCTDCLEILEIKNNGDGTIDLTVRIRHPFLGFPEYTGFDVKGIMIFNGSYEFPYDSNKFPLPRPFFRISWRQLGDPEVLNPDGYTPRWSPNWDSGSDLPIFNYWEGKYASGVPNADLNAYLDFYSHEERHIFLTDSQVQRTYQIWLPPGKPVVAGYAVEACWEPPTVTPVRNPFADFPVSANQPEAYYFRYVVNNGEEIADCDEWPFMGWDCSVMYVEVAQWGGITSDDMFRRFEPDGGWGGFGILDCDPPMENRFGAKHMAACEFGNGTHRGVCVNYRFRMGYQYDIAYTVFDWTVNDPNLEE